MDAKHLNRIKKQILAALSHPEAEDGLYFNNLIVVHEEEERPIVEGEEDAVQRALDQLVADGIIVREDTPSTPIFKLSEQSQAAH
jgi:hypothetical protein